MEARGLGLPGENPRLAERAALMTRAAKRDVGREELREVWTQQAVDLGFDAGGLVAEAMDRSAGGEIGAEGVTPETGTADSDGARSGSGDGPQREGAGDFRPDLEMAAEMSPAAAAVAWAMAHLSEREAVFARSDLLAAALAHAPGRVSIKEVEREVAGLERAGSLHAVDMPGARDSLATDRTVGEERETVALMRAGQARGRATMRSWMVQAHLSRGL